MATKKAAPGKGLRKWDEELARKAQLSAKMEENSLGLGNSISTQGGILAYKDNPIPGNKMNVIVLDAIYANVFYQGAFDPETPENPVCFAFGTEETAMAPHELSTDKQHDKCITCPMGGKEAWGSADVGKGKACKNKRRFILLTEDALETGIVDAQAATLMIPVTSVKGWAGYVTNLATSLNKPPMAVITEISLVPNKKSQFEVKFKLVSEIDEEHFEALFAKVDAVQTELYRPYTPIEDAPPARGAGKAAANRGAKGKVKGARR